LSPDLGTRPAFTNDNITVLLSAVLIQRQQRIDAGCNLCRGCTFLNRAVKEQIMLGTILLVILVLALFGALPRWSHSRNWGYAPTGGVGLILLVVVILLVLGRI
jgi:hypothetical protein